MIDVECDHSLAVCISMASDGTQALYGFKVTWHSQRRLQSDRPEDRVLRSVVTKIQSMRRDTVEVDIVGSSIIVVAYSSSVICNIAVILGYVHIQKRLQLGS